MPRFSIITPVYNPPRYAFEACVGSVLSQSNGDWEWCLSNDASPDEWVSRRLAELQSRDSRIRVVNRLANGGIVAASNDAISIAQGDFLVLLDNDDELHPDALRLVVETLDNEPNTDYLYSDEDKLTPDGTRFDTFAKPVWSPERLLAQNYTSHLSVLRRTLVDAVGRFRKWIRRVTGLRPGSAGGGEGATYRPRPPCCTTGVHCQPLRHQVQQPSHTRSLPH